MEVGLYVAKTKLSQLVERAIVGKEILIAKAGKPMGKLVRLGTTPNRVHGSAAGSIAYGEGWDAAMSDEEFDVWLGG